MDRRPLGTTGFHISPIGLGAWAMGGSGWAFSWGAQEDRDSIDAIHTALDAGVNWIDTAAVYGLGHSEEVVARGVSGLAQPPFLFTKCGRVWGGDQPPGVIGKCLKRASIQAECDASLRRLKVDCIDLYQIHWPEPDEDIEEGWQTLTELRQAGKVRAIAVSNFSVSQLERINQITPVQTLQPPYSLIRREVEAELMPYCMERKIGVHSYSPMRCGLLSGKMTRQRLQEMPADDWRKNSPDFNEPLLDRNLSIADTLAKIGAKQNATAGAAAVAWVLNNPAVSGAIVGFRGPEQVSPILESLKVQFSADDLANLHLASTPY